MDAPDNAEDIIRARLGALGIDPGRPGFEVDDSRPFTVDLHGLAPWATDAPGPQSGPSASASDDAPSSPAETPAGSPEDDRNPFWPPCSAQNRKGKHCRFPARRGRGLCINHDPEYRQKQEENRLKGSKEAQRQRNRPPVTLAELDLSERSSIQALVEAVITLELRGSMSATRSRNLIRLLSIATRNLRNSQLGWVTHSDASARHGYHRARTRLHAQLEALDVSAFPVDDA